MTSEPLSQLAAPRRTGNGSGEPRRRRSSHFLRRSPASGRELRTSVPARTPFDRLRFWTVRHQLRERLAAYEASALPEVFRYSHWATLRYWALLLDEDDEELIRFIGLDTEIPDPDEWFGRVEV